ncbi:hypothetical protein CALCODRAFT_442356 [Calocera cornea HHB12733]|uniref:ESCRT-II complex, vps25 subunit n=1 Tax=Calocera cornea HHB12733 TaxID=1353952 RepID=A0A165D2L6_9BASI|nr:hypothetical protein CALCODRAFT_442356 [Calocera cornea HHB12733]
MPGLELAPYQTPSGFTLPSIHSWSAFYTYQPNPRTLATQTQHWTQLLLTYARARRLFALSLADADLASAGKGAWAEVLHNPRLKPPSTSAHYTTLHACAVLLPASFFAPGQAGAESVILCWRTVGEWAGVLHDWALQTGQTSTILTLFEISNPPVPSELSDIPEPLLRRAVGVLQRSGKAQVIEGEGGGGVRIFA